MKYSTETLMTYVDGELDDAATERAIDAAIADDPELALAVAKQVAERRSLRAKLQAGFGSALVESVPERLIKATRADVEAGTAAVVDLARVRDTKRPAQARRWSLQHWSAIAASVILGVIISRVGLDRMPEVAMTEHGGLLAQGPLDSALSDQLGGAMDRQSGIALGMSYIDTSGDYCRTFSINKAQTVAGLACRRDSGWIIDAVLRGNSSTASAYRMANTEMPESIRAMIEGSMVGDPLDASQEAQARQRGWE